MKAAQQRYETVPDIDPTTGQEKTIVVTGQDGKPKKDKHGQVIVRRLTVEDRSRPLPNHVCDRCGKEIIPGEPYKWVPIFRGPRKNRCGACPKWSSWELSSSLEARLEEIAHNFWQDLDGAGSDGELKDAIDEIVNAVREIADEKDEAADNMEDGFGHPIPQSDEMHELAEALRSWADEIEDANVPGLEEYADDDDNEEGPSDEQVDRWREDVASELSMIDEPPLS